jgi:hypothetical protein
MLLLLLLVVVVLVLVLLVLVVVGLLLLCCTQLTNRSAMHRVHVQRRSILWALLCVGTSMQL